MRREDFHWDGRYGWPTKVLMLVVGALIWAFVVMPPLVTYVATGR